MNIWERVGGALARVVYVRVRGRARECVCVYIDCALLAVRSSLSGAWALWRGVGLLGGVEVVVGAKARGVGSVIYY